MASPEPWAFYQSGAPARSVPLMLKVKSFQRDTLPPVRGRRHAVGADESALRL